MQEKRYSLTETELKELLADQRKICAKAINDQRDTRVKYDMDISMSNNLIESVCIRAEDPPLPIPSEEVKPIGYLFNNGICKKQELFVHFGNTKALEEHYENATFIPLYTTPPPVISEEEIEKILKQVYGDMSKADGLTKNLVEAHRTGFELAIKYIKSKLNGEEEAK